MQCGVGSRGSSIVLDQAGEKIHELLDDAWRIMPEDTTFQASVLETEAGPNGEVSNWWEECAPLPETEAWFEITWADFRAGKIYED